VSDCADTQLREVVLLYSLTTYTRVADDLERLKREWHLPATGDVVAEALRRANEDEEIRPPRRL
jgi:hypothetical protein